jgi:hypothetical protein
MHPPCQPQTLIASVKAASGGSVVPSTTSEIRSMIERGVEVLKSVVAR